MAKPIKDARIVITGTEEQAVFYALADGRVYAADHMGSGMHGMIYAGYVDHVVTNLQAAFVRFNGKDTGFLQFKDVPDAALCNRAFQKGDALKAGDLLAVQTERLPAGTKQAKLTGYLSLSGTYSVLTCGKSGIGCSSRIGDDLRKKLTDRVRRALTGDVRFDRDFFKSYGIIIRTEAAACTDADGIARIVSEIAALREKLYEIRAHAAVRTAGTLLYAPDISAQCEQILTAQIHLLHALQADADKDMPLKEITIVAEDLFMAERIAGLSPVKAHEEIHILRFDGDAGVSMSAVYQLDGISDLLSQRIVRLKSGAYLVIDTAEAMTVIDVNSGKNIRSKNDFFLRVNLEAAEEAMRQIRLRNVRGIIMIDFINMPHASDAERLGSRLRELAALDTAHTRFVDFTALGIAELVRSDV